MWDPESGSRFDIPHHMKNSDEDDGHLKSYVRLRLRSESGFMGMTHALSAVAVMLVLLVFNPSIMDRLFGSNSIPVFLLMLLVVTGGALMPDLDNTQSSAKSSLGFVGDGISMFMRATSPIIQSLFSSKRDKKPGDDRFSAHRGFYHTFLCAFLFGLLCFFLCSDRVNLHVMGLSIDGRFFAVLLAFIGAHIALSTLFGTVMRKMKGGSKILGFIIPTLVSVAVIIVLWSFLPTNMSYSRIGVAFGLGWVIHILGDMCTTQGVPALAPIPIKGKCWYDIRLLPIEAGGAVENYVITPILIAIIIFSMYTYLVDLGNPIDQVSLIMMGLPIQ